MTKRVWAGVDIGGTKTAVVVSRELPDVLGRRVFPTRPDDGPGHAIDSIRASLRELLLESNAAIAGIGVSCGSPLDWRAGVIQAPPNLPTWVDVPIADLLKREFGCEVRLENDANAGAVAEHRFGAGRGAEDVVFLTLGTGLGAGIIANGRLYRGASNSAGEIGHVRLTRKGPVGYHKAGSVEGWASGGGIGRVAERIVTGAESRGIPTALSAIRAKGQALTARDVAEAMRAGDRVASRIVRIAARKLGETLAIVVDVLNPQRIVVGGLALRLGDALLEPARERMQREALPQSTAVCEVVPAELGERIGDVAALCVATGLD